MKASGPLSRIRVVLSRPSHIAGLPNVVYTTRAGTTTNSANAPARR